MAAAAQYGTGFFSTPSDLLNAANQVNDQITAIDTAIDGNNSIPQSWWDGFQSFRAAWLAYFSSTFGGQGFDSNSGSIGTTTASWFTSDVESQIVSYETQTATWAQQAASYGSPIAGPIIQPPSDSPFNLPSVAGISGVLILLIVLLIVFDVSK